MRIITGLGNPGLRYAHTRHNVGFDVLDMFAKKHGVRIRRKYCRALVGDARILGEEFVLAKPQTFMNSSGEAVREILVRQKLMPPFLMVVC
ncbi:MAG: aminoacyl-tRNA hydrolase, partial [Armatimonadota bacterium]